MHTNLIADDADKLIAFYKNVLRCRSIGEVRDLRGKWLDEMTGLEHAHITGEHLALPGYGDNLPTLEILSYESTQDAVVSDVNRPGFAHIAFEVDNVCKTPDDIVANGGSAVGKVVSADYPNGVRATFVYAKDPEGNILELQSWERADEKE